MVRDEACEWVVSQVADWDMKETIKRWVFWWIRDSRIFLHILFRLQLIKHETASRLGLINAYPWYHLGLTEACFEASRLGVKSIYALEFGVAGGKGLHHLVKAASALEKRFPVKVHVLGFDSGTGMPRPIDHRDAPHLWNFGDFPMDREVLKTKLKGRAQVLLGMVADSIKLFDSRSVDLSRGSEGNVEILFPEMGIDTKIPVGFVAFDLDYWSSTRDALNVFETVKTLPRVWSYFDDLNYVAENQGEYLAIRDHNSGKTGAKSFISRVELSLPHWVNWAHRMRIVHFFDHESYCVPIHGFQELRL